MEMHADRGVLCIGPFQMQARKRFEAVHFNLIHITAADQEENKIPPGVICNYQLDVRLDPVQ